MKNTKILAFETSCDDTAAAIVENGKTVLSSIRVSQVEHNDWGGVVPEIAARLHSENWRNALEACLKEARLKIEEIDYFACTQGPGLQTSLLTGTSAASFLSLLYRKPLIPVHHIHGHICAVFLNSDFNPNFPELVLTVSGGHTQLHLLESFTELTCLGKSIDDAAGEAFDKVAKMLGLGYPGGPIVSQLAKKGDRRKYEMPKIYLEKDSLDFSFSGLKSAVYRLVEQEKKNRKNLSENFVNDVCASFEFTVGKIFLKKIERAFEQYPQANNLLFVGGVSANNYLKKGLSDFLQTIGKKLITPVKKEFSTDNAAMIASAAYFLIKQDPNIAQVQFIDANSRLSLNHD